MDDRVYLVDSDDWHRLTWRYAARPLRLAEADIEAREAICRQCVWYAIRAADAQCDHPERRCSKLYPTSATEACPLAKWPTVDTPRKGNPP